MIFAPEHAILKLTSEAGSGRHPAGLALQDWGTVAFRAVRQAVRRLDSRLNSLLLHLLLPLLQFLQELLRCLDLLLSILLLLLVVGCRLVVRLISLVGLIIGRVISASIGRVIRRVVLILGVLTFDSNDVSTRSCHRHCRWPVIDGLVVGDRLLGRLLRSAIDRSATRLGHQNHPVQSVWISRRPQAACN